MSRTGLSVVALLKRQICRMVIESTLQCRDYRGFRFKHIRF